MRTHIEDALYRPVVDSRLLVRAFSIISELEPVDRELWYDKRVLGIGDTRQAARLGVSKARIWQRVDRAERRIQKIRREVAA